MMSSDLIAKLKERTEAGDEEGVLHNGMYEIRTNTGTINRANQSCSSLAGDLFIKECDSYLEHILSGIKAMSGNSHEEFLILKQRKIDVVKDQAQSHKKALFISYLITFSIAAIPALFSF